MYRFAVVSGLVEENDQNCPMTVEAAHLRHRTETEGAEWFSRQNGKSRYRCDARG